MNSANWYKKAQSQSDFQRGDEVTLIEKHPDSNTTMSDLDENRFYVDEDEQKYYLSQYPVSFGDSKGSVHQYNKSYYKIEKA